MGRGFFPMQKTHKTVFLIIGTLVLLGLLASLGDPDIGPALVGFGIVIFVMYIFIFIPLKILYIAVKRFFVDPKESIKELKPTENQVLNILRRFPMFFK